MKPNRLTIPVLVLTSAVFMHAGEPVWWVGAAGAANLNFYGGMTQNLNPAVTTLTPFREGFGAGLYLAPVVEYRPDPVWGAILQVGYDERRGDFFEVTCPCGEQSTLSAKPAYLSIEPSLRFAPFAGGLHLFAGPRLAFLAPWGDPRAFQYHRKGISTTEGEFDAMREVIFSGHAGVGYDLVWAPANGRRRVQIAPFVSFHPHFGQAPRETDYWGIATLRVGAVLKFGRVKPGPAHGPDIRLSVRAPARVVVRRRIHETFPLRNYVFFEAGSSGLPARYVTLTVAQASSFREEHLQDSLPARATGRSVRQITVYRNLLNILGDRMRRNPGATITLTGLFAQRPEEGRERAEAVRHYLIETFGIDGARIAVAERAQPPLPSGRSYEELKMLGDENQRVEIQSQSREMLVQIGEGANFMLKPVEIDGETAGADSVIFTASGAESLASWWLEILDAADTAVPPRRIGPFIGRRAAVPAAPLLGDRPRATFMATLTAAQTGVSVRRSVSFALFQRNHGIDQTTRFAILFDIDQARAVSSYERFLTEVVASRVADSGGVMIRGRTDIVGERDYNLALSRGRAESVQRILEAATAARGRRGVSFRPTWSGEDPKQAPFGNTTPEERNYNRTVIIDIVPE
jgi:outer membrane protein OmpA-like peptidoglycan-associated protein